MKAGDSKMIKIARAMKNVQHFDPILNRTVKNQVILKALDAK